MVRARVFGRLFTFLLAVAVIATVSMGGANAQELAGTKTSDAALLSGNKAAIPEDKEYDVSGRVVSALVYQYFIVTVDDAEDKKGKTFQGDAGGVTIPGVDFFWGTLHTPDLEKLYSDTVSFQYNAAATFLNINFFDSKGGRLGYVLAGAAGTVSGIGGGTGGWE
uniref:Virulence associated protein D n=1 Tax=Rhodococcus hoagii TaxID=43767 RepID=W5QKX2_RHOHA|nr:virulence associated protein D [Prescottella equi]